MSGLTVLWADGNEEFQKPIADYLSHSSHITEITCVSNGEEAINALSMGSFDVVVTEVLLTHIDGLGVLEYIQNIPTDKRPQVLVLTKMMNNGIVNASCLLHATYCMSKPIEPSILERRIADIGYSDRLIRAVKTDCCMPKDSTRTTPEKMIDGTITAMFLVMGLPAHIKGYHYLREAIKRVYANPALMGRITTDLYPEVALAFDTTPARVERSIRNAIDVAWNRGKLTNINKIFGYAVYNEHDKPTNGEFIALVSDKLIMDIGDTTPIVI